MGSFVRKVTTASGATAVQIMHKRGRRVLGIDHIGSARTEAELALLEAIAHERLHAGQDQLPLDHGGSSASTAAPGMGATVAGTSSRVLWQALERVYADLGFDVLGDEAFKQLVLARIIEPTSKADTVRVLEELGVPSRTRETFMRCLSRVVERNYRDQLGAACYAHAAPTGRLAAVLYD
ncbi:IS1634 family transposase, partial [Ornithinimicrobium panacihumi]